MIQGEKRLYYTQSGRDVDGWNWSVDGADNPYTTLLNGNQKLIKLNVLPFFVGGGGGVIK